MSPEPPEPSDPQRSRASRRGLTRAAAWIVLVVGVLTSVMLAAAVRVSIQQRSDGNVEESARSMTAEVRAALQRELDLTEAARTYVALSLDEDTPPALQRWFDSMDLSTRYPELDGIGFVEVIPAQELADFARRTRGVELDPTEDPAQQLGLQPPGARPFYCLGAAGVPGTAFSPIPVTELDLCGGPVPTVDGEVYDPGPRLLEAARTGVSMLDPRIIQGRQVLSVAVPVYRPGEPDASGRFEGWVTALFRLDQVLSGVLPTSVESGVRLSLVEPDGEVSLAGEAGAATFANPDAVQQTTTFEELGEWRLDMEIVPPTTGRQLNVVTVGLGVLCLAVTGLLFALVRVLASSKDRAWTLVEDRTAELSHLALHDPLTGLPNRALVMDRLDHLLARARRRDSVPAVLFIDLDGFKAVNDTFGHPAGDQLLIDAAARLRATVRDAETVGRLGGDEFVVLLEQEHDLSEATAVAARVIEAFAAPFELPAPVDEAVVVGASIGVAIGLRDGADELIRDADVALYEAKAGGKGRYVVFRSEMQAALETRMRAELHLRRALEREELTLLYVPIVDLRSGEVHSAEAVLDWHHPTVGPMSQRELSEVVEDTGLAVPVGRWMLRRACQDAARFRIRSPIASVGVNITTRHLLADGFVDDVERALVDAGAPPSALVVELGESLLFSEPGAPARQVVEQLRRLGVGVAASDFARRYTSLVEPSSLPADALKIQPEFVVGVARSTESAVAVDTVVHLAHGLGVFVVAEGVSEPEDLEALRRLGCDLVQGLPADTAVPAADLLERLGTAASVEGGDTVGAG